MPKSRRHICKRYFLAAPKQSHGGTLPGKIAALLAVGYLAHYFVFFTIVVKLISPVLACRLSAGLISNAACGFVCERRGLGPVLEPT